MTRRAREKPYVCVDVDLPDHERLIACEDPGGCLGLWVALIAYSRAYLTDGKVSKKVASLKWSDPRNASRIEDMLRSGLLVETETHYEIFRYAPRNQTKAMVEKDREEARIRMANVRANKERTSGEVRRTNAFVPISTSPSDLSGSDLGGSGGATAEVVPETGSGVHPIAARRSVPPPVDAIPPLPAERVVFPDTQIPAELRSAAEITGVRDIDGAWLKFCGHFAGHTIHVQGKWQSWCVNERNIEARRASGPRKGPFKQLESDLWKPGEAGGKIEEIP